MCGLQVQAAVSVRGEGQSSQYLVNRVNKAMCGLQVQLAIRVAIVSQASTY